MRLFLSFDHRRYPNLTTHIQAGFCIGHETKIPLAVIDQDITKAAIQPAELGKKTKFISPRNKIRETVSIQISDTDSIDG